MIAHRRAGRRQPRAVIASFEQRNVEIALETHDQL
jgi:hypothetical protein